MLHNSNKTFTIEPLENRSVFDSIVNLYQYRELLLTLAWRDYKVKYRQTFVGIAWAIFQPLLAMFAFVFIFGRIAGISPQGIPYALYVYSGMVIWQFFSSAISEASMSLRESSQMITKIYFPRIVIPVAKVMTLCIDLFFSLSVLAILMLYYGHIPSVLGIVTIIPTLIVLFVISTSIGSILSAINVKYRDVQYILPYFVQLGLFLSPVIYSGTNLGAYRNLLFLNPATGIIDMFRYSLFGSSFPTVSFAISCMIAIVLWLFGSYYFAKAEGEFSDVI
ncbi:MAG: ABC transporter permease [Patescibacteria group bacterium]|nr:ABC transporter permease [Patescibacteria group bacterium]